ncbi:hypothetical protein DFS34DRAFT_603924 [Phlyctochytrium arcticum]|nr:hypothetical protein DFS34DRAFT_603924 [Phlyctochytrium arcticum]
MYDNNDPESGTNLCDHPVDSSTPLPVTNGKYSRVDMLESTPQEPDIEHRKPRKASIPGAIVVASAADDSAESGSESENEYDELENEYEEEFRYPSDKSDVVASMRRGFEAGRAVNASRASGLSGKASGVSLSVMSLNLKTERSGKSDDIPSPTEEAPVHDGTGIPKVAPPFTPIDIIVLPLTMLISLFVYCPFCVAVVFQSCVTRRAVNTDNYKNEMKGWAWGVGFLIFFGLLLYPTAVAGWMETLTQRGWRVMSVVAVFLCVIGVVQVLTIVYAFLKPGLGMVTLQTHGTTLMHWRHFLPLLAPLIEFSQFTSLAFRTSSDSWLCSTTIGLIVRGGVRLSTLRLDDLACEGDNQTKVPDLFYAATAVAFGACCVYTILLGYAIARFLQPGHWLCNIVFEVFAGLLYLPIVSRLLSVLDCRTQTDPVTGVANMYLQYADFGQAYVPVECWVGPHKHYTGMAFAGLLIYGLSAIFVGSYKADKHTRRSSVAFIPRIVVIKRAITSAFLAINLLIAHTSTNPDTVTSGRRAMGCLTLGILLFIDSFFNSCTFDKLRVASIGAHLAALWAYVAAIVSFFHTPIQSTIVLFAGWGLIGVAMSMWLGLLQRSKLKKDAKRGSLKRDKRDVGRVFKVVTMRRTLTHVTVPADCVDEDQAIAQALYGTISRMP